MAISAHELRIGNLVEINGKISELNRKRFEYAVCKDCCLGMKPIPLTEEWLLKFGFVFLSDIGVYKLKFTISTQAGEFEFAGVPKSIGFISNGLFASGNIIYVHQLQNLYFALCGEELKLN